MTETHPGAPADARARHRGGRLEEAERVYGTALEQDPENSDAWHLLGRVAMQRGELLEAAARVLQAIRRRPADPAYLTTLGQILAAQRRDREAVASYREALRLAPDYVPALVNLAQWREIPGVEWHSLQVEEFPRREAGKHAAWLHPCLEDPPHAGYLAAMMTCMDLIVTVDTMRAHLAGAIARPVWVLLGFVPDWRWQIARESSPWYPGMRLFRQPRPGDWEAVVERVRRELHSLASNFPDTHR